MSDRVCGGCGEDLTGTHGKRKWCSERCRRRTLYTNECRHCGAEVYDGGAEPPDECGDCKHDAYYGERNAAIETMWSEGRSVREIAQALELKEGQVRGRVQSARDEGEFLPFHRLPSANKEERYQLIGRLVRQGLTNQEIAERVGAKSAASVAFMTVRARKQGFDVPRRSELVA